MPHSAAIHPSPPLSREPESFDPEPWSGTYPFGGSPLTEQALSRVSWPARSLVPERFRGGCSFGVPGRKTRKLSRACLHRLPDADATGMLRRTVRVNREVFHKRRPGAGRGRHVGRDTPATGRPRPPPGRRLCLGTAQAAPDKLARRVILQLRIRELEPNQRLERRAQHRLPHLRPRQRIERRGLVPRLALRQDLAANILGQRRRSA